MFVDECEVQVHAGKGGDGALSFWREKFVAFGGPDGGEGGRGGSIFFVASGHMNSLLKIARRPKYQAQNGQPGGTSNKSGRGGEDLVVEVPTGTQVYDKKRGNLLGDLAHDGDRLEVARGGRGGRGNASFVTAVKQAPRETEPGEAGEHRELRLELKLFAQVGLVGLPNAGKSTFLASISRATPKIANYPFTTLHPHVGVAEVGTYDTLVVADLPGLIEGAAEGHGLGHRFLKHVERCRVLLVLLDVSSGADMAPEEAFAVLRGELERYDEGLARRPFVVAATKVEDEESEQRAARLAENLRRTVHCISSHTRRGVADLVTHLHRLVLEAEGRALPTA
jgi:GTP-binding protein